MGYELAIKKEGDKISKESWLEFLEKDIEFKQINEFSAETSAQETISISIPNAGLWKNEVPFTFDEKRGEICVQSPDVPTIEKMVGIAKIFDAIVVGEEEEIYDEKFIANEKSMPGVNLDDYKNIKMKPFDPNKKWWQFWK